MIKSRKVIKQCEVKSNGNIDVKEINEFYDDEITPTKAVFKDLVIPEQPALYDESGDIVRQIIPEGKTLVEVSPEVTDIIGYGTPHRYVVSSEKQTPEDVQAFLNNSKA